MVLMAAGELTGAVIWVSSTGLEMMNDQLALTYAPLTIFMGLAGYGLVMTPAMIGMGKVVHRFFPDAKKGRRDVYKRQPHRARPDDAGPRPGTPWKRASSRWTRRVA